MQKQLTDLAIQRLPEGVYHDTKTPAFGIRVGKNRRTWFYVHAKNRKRIGLGHYPALSLADARKRALVALGSPHDERPTIAFKDALETFLALPRWRPQSKKVLTSSLRHFTWKRNLDKITHEDVQRVLEAVPGSSAKAHALKDIRTFFNWCVPRYLAASPAAGLKMEAQPSRDRILTPEELKAVWKACDGTFGTIVKLLILTGQRKTEIGSLKWDYVAKDEKSVTLPAAVTKNGREHIFPLGDLARALLPKRGKGLVFRATGSEDVYNGYTYHLKQLQKTSKTSGWTIHDLRRTYVSLHAEINTPIHIAEKLVNHVSGTFAGVRGIYDRYSYTAEMAEAATAIAKRISEIVKD